MAFCDCGPNSQASLEVVGIVLESMHHTISKIDHYIELGWEGRLAIQQGELLSLTQGLENSRSGLHNSCKPLLNGLVSENEPMIKENRVVDLCNVNPSNRKSGFVFGSQTLSSSLPSIRL